MKWTKEETVEVLGLYLKERPRAQDKGEKQVQECAEKLGRTVASIAMKIANFVFMDPLAEDAGRKGMSQISILDQDVWVEFSGDQLAKRVPNPQKKNEVASSEDGTLDANFYLNNRVRFSLLSKPFLILTGNSGTGKTRSAEDFVMRFRDVEDAKSAKNVALVAVGADWTDNRNVVGFVNHLRPITVASDDERPIYQSTPILDLLLEASSPERALVPHFLILDEMNLSHVERYFADFLSAMEARYGAIRLHDEGPRGKADFRLPRFEGDAVGVPRELPYPKNLFVIGTVNVDETTYMFSPKVLDRAHVIEFEVDPAEVAAFLDEPKPLEPVPRAPMGEAEAFLQFSLRARGMKEPGLDALPMAVKRKVNGALIDLLEILQKGRFEFAFRTAKEVAAYMRVCRELRSKDGWDEAAWQADLDDEILQKVLPRLHGSRTRVGPLLGALGWYLHSSDKAGAMEFFPPLGEELPKKSVQEIIPLKDGEFPRSFGKIQRMARVVVEEQFVSFIC